MARLIHPLSKECMLDEMNLFGVPLTQTMIESSIEQSLKPMTPIQASPEQIEFKIQAEGGMYVDLRSPHLVMDLQIVDKDMKAVSKDAKVAITNNVAQSLFQKVDATLNGINTSSSSGNYPWKAYLHSLCGFRRSAKTNFMSIVPWLKDVSGKMDEPNFDRNKMVTPDISKSFQVACYPMCDIFMQNRFMISTADIGIKLQRSAAGFALVAENASEQFSIVIRDITLYYTKYQVSEALLTAHMAAMIKTTVKFPLVRTDVKAYPVAMGNLYCSIDNAYHGELPDRVLAIMVNEDAYNGHSNRNPYNLQHYNSKTACAIRNGRQYPTKPYNMNFADRTVVKPFVDMYANMGQLRDNNPTLDITLPEFLDGYTIISFNFAPDLSDPSDQHVNLLSRGNIRFEFEWMAKLPENIVILFFAQFNSIIEIDNSNTVHKDY